MGTFGTSPTPDGCMSERVSRNVLELGRLPDLLSGSGRVCPEEMSISPLGGATGLGKNDPGTR